MMMSKILKFVDFTKTQRFRSQEWIVTFLQTEKSTNCIFNGYFVAKSRFIAELTFNVEKIEKNPKLSKTIPTMMAFWWNTSMW